ncbi:MAG: aminotransferase class I/II-fold pyridoxal phosphate-dependent enzyme [Candidatus Woesearchaeota archaeon]
MKEIIPAKRTEKIQYAIRDVAVEAQRLEGQGKKIIYLNIGDPLKYDFETPKHLIEAVEKNWKKSSSYADSLGLKEAREAIANEAKRNGLNVDYNDVVLTSGGSEGITMALGALLNPGDNVLTPKPGYPLYNAVINYFDGIENEYELDEDNNWLPDIEDMRRKINEKTKAIVLINPNNPTGAIYSKKQLKEIVDLAAENDLPIFSDETYDKILLDDDKFYSVGSLTDEIPVLTFNTLSKNYLCPGWRVGWTIFSGYIEKRSKFQEAFNQLARARLSISHPMQYAVKPALEGSQKHLNDMITKLRKRRDLTYKRLNEIPYISLVKPRAAFYAFPKIDLTNFDFKDDKEFVLNLLKEEHVLFVHGSGFGQKENTNHFRVVFAASEEALEKGYNKLETFVKRHLIEK